MSAMETCQHTRWVKSVIPWGSCQDCGIDAEVWIKSQLDKATAERDEALDLIREIQSWMPTIIGDDEELEDLTDKIEAILEKRK